MESRIICSNEVNVYEEVFKNTIYDKVRLNDEDWQQLKNSFIFKTARPNTYLLRKNGFELCGRFIIKGIVKVTHHIQNPYVFDFREQNSFLCDVDSLINQNRSCFSFATITNCEWIETDIYHLSRINNKIMHAVSILMLDYLSKGYERASFLRITNAEERYAEFCKSHPQIIKYAKQGDIASYIDITTQSLSRIRKNVINSKSKHL